MGMSLIIPFNKYAARMVLTDPVGPWILLILISLVSIDFLVCAYACLVKIYMFTFAQLACGSICQSTP